jgi:hypothetical protein
MLSFRAYEIVSSLVTMLVHGAGATIALVSALIAVAALLL